MLIRKAKQEYYFSKFERNKHNMKQTWNTINNIIGRGEKLSSQLQSKFKDERGNILTDPADIANEFNDFFCTCRP